MQREPVISTEGDLIQHIHDQLQAFVIRKREELPAKSGSTIKSINGIAIGLRPYLEKVGITTEVGASRLRSRLVYSSEIQLLLRELNASIEVADARHPHHRHQPKPQQPFLRLLTTPAR